MKKIFLLITIALAAAFAEPEGKYVDVELLSGTHQRAKFLGIENDTVSLGGYIQNKFTVVKIAKKQFKKIVDEQGNDLLNKADDSKPATKTENKVEPEQAKPVATQTEAAPVERKNAEQAKNRIEKNRTIERKSRTKGFHNKQASIKRIS